MNFSQIIYILTFGISLLSLISIAIFTKSDENKGNYTTTSWITLGLDCAAMILSLSLFKKNKQTDETKPH